MMRDKKPFILVGLCLVAVVAHRLYADELKPMTDHGGPESNVEGPVKSPIQHQSILRDERDLFGYNPRYNPTVPSFDLDNRPYLQCGWYIQTIDDEGNWIVLDASAAVRRKYPDVGGYVAFMDPYVVHDNAGDAYILGRLGPLKGTERSFRYGLMHSTDRCRTWTFYATPVRVERFEHAEAHNQINGPPPMVEGRGGELNLVVTEKKDDGTLSAPRRILVANVVPPVVSKGRHWITPAHSGCGNVLATRDAKTHIVWLSIQPLNERQEADAAEMTRKTGLEGLAPCFAATYDHHTGQVSEQTYLGLTRRDNHNGPTISVDADGYLHVLIGAHHANYWYQRSKKPNSTIEGFTEPAMIGNLSQQGKGGDTYQATACDQDNTLHVVTRWAGQGPYVFHLAYLRKKPRHGWEPHRLLVSPDRNNYINWHHRISHDRRGRLFVSYAPAHYYLSPEYVEVYKRRWPDKLLPDFEKTQGTYQNNPCMLISDDHGDTWRLALTKDFVAGLNVNQ
jgi:hypothetical protein